MMEKNEDRNNVLIYCAKGMAIEESIEKCMQNHNKCLLANGFKHSCSKPSLYRNSTVFSQQWPSVFKKRRDDGKKRIPKLRFDKLCQRNEHWGEH